MAITILQQPQALTFVGNIPEIIVQTSGLNMTVNVSLGGTEILSESYTADADGRARVRLKDFLNDQLSLLTPAGDLFEQTKSVRQFDVEVIVGVETESFSFVTIKGGVDKPLLDCQSYMKEAWLTWQPQSKIVRDIDPEWLSYFAVFDSDVIVRAYFSGGTFEVITLHSLEAGKHYTMNMAFSDIREEFEFQPIYFDVWVQNKPGVPIVDRFETYHQRYILTSENFDYDDLFLFENSVGGIDTIRLTGEKRAVNPVEVDSALFYDESTFDYQVNPNKAFEKNTGFFRSKEALYWAQDFFQSVNKYIYLDEELIRILLRNPEIITLETELVDFDFKFAFTKQTPYLALFKKKSPLIDPVIIGPGDEEFYLPPKISDFPQLDDPTDALFPVQVPGTPGWLFLTWTTLLEYIYDGLPPVLHNQTIGIQGGKPADGEDPAEYYHLPEAAYLEAIKLGETVNQETKFLSGGFWIYSGVDLIFTTIYTECQFPGSNDIVKIDPVEIDLSDYPELDNDTEPQFVRPKWDSAGGVLPIFGDASSDPQEPAVEDPLTEIAGTSLLLNAGATSIDPEQISTQVIFAEGALGEASLAHTGAGTADYADAVAPIAGALSANTSNVQNSSREIATLLAAVNPSDYEFLAIKIQLKAPMMAGHTLRVFFATSPSGYASNIVVLPINKANLGVQVVAVPFSSFTFNGNSCTRLMLQWYRSGSADAIHPGYRFDDWILQNGIVPPTLDTSIVLQGQVAGSGRVGENIATTITEKVISDQAELSTPVGTEEVLVRKADGSLWKTPVSALGTNLNPGIVDALEAGDSPSALNAYVTVSLLNSYAYVQEAPINGNYYARRNGAWSSITPFSVAGTPTDGHVITSVAGVPTWAEASGGGGGGTGLYNGSNNLTELLIFKSHLNSGAAGTMFRLDSLDNVPVIEVLGNNVPGWPYYNRPQVNFRNSQVKIYSVGSSWQDRPLEIINSAGASILSVNGEGSMSVAGSFVPAQIGCSARANFHTTFPGWGSIGWQFTYGGTAQSNRQIYSIGGGTLIAQEINLRAKNDTTSHSVQVANFSGVNTIKVLGNHSVYLYNYPTSDPLDAGKIWVDPSTGYTLKVSQG